MSRERHVLGLISIGHFLSHHYGLVLPPLFPFLKAEFGVSYLQLGLAMTACSLLRGVAQSPVGFLVDRVGAARVLLAQWTSWRTALFVTGAAGLLALLVMLRQRALLQPPAAPQAASRADADSDQRSGADAGAGTVAAASTGLRLLMTLPVLLFGWFLDHGQPARIFILAGGFAVLALAATAAAQRCALPGGRSAHT